MPSWQMSLSHSHMPAHKVPAQHGQHGVDWLACSAGRCDLSHQCLNRRCCDAGSRHGCDSAQGCDIYRFGALLWELVTQEQPGRRERRKVRCVWGSGIGKVECFTIGCMADAQGCPSLGGSACSVTVGLGLQ